MPIYEYRCRSCTKLSSFFVRSISSKLEPACAHCQSNQMERRMSSFATGKTVGSVHGNFSSGNEHRSPGYYNDPRNIGRNVEENFSRHGLKMPQPVRETIDAARDGNVPKGLDICPPQTHFRKAATPLWCIACTPSLSNAPIHPQPPTPCTACATWC